MESYTSNVSKLQRRDLYLNCFAPSDELHNGSVISERHFKLSTSSSSRWRTPKTSSISRQQEASRPASNVAETLVFEWQLIANIISANKQGKEAKRWWRFSISGCLAGIRNVGSEEKFSTD